MRDTLLAATPAPAEVVPVARVESMGGEPAEVTPAQLPEVNDASGNGPKPRTMAKARAVPAGRIITDPMKAAGEAARACLTTQDPVNLEITVTAERAELKRVEWVSFKLKDPTESCIARAIGSIRFPDTHPAGTFRLKIGR